MNQGYLTPNISTHSYLLIWSRMSSSLNDKEDAESNPHMLL
jgi:hypothetical protein